MLEKLSHLKQDKEGIYRSIDEGHVSYPDDGNKECFLLEDDSFWFKHRNKCISSVIGRNPPSGEIVDVGGGNGYVTRGILDDGFDAILLEPGKEGAINGKKVRHIPTVICSTFQNARFDESSISAIGCFDVIEHVEDDNGMAEHFSRVLKPGGMLYVTVPAHNWLWSQSDDSGQHYRRYNREMIEQLLASKYEIIYFTYFFSILSIPILMFRSLPYRLSFIKKNILSKNTEHGANRGFGSGLINYFLKRELNKIKSGKSLKFGASCLIVARKKG